MKSNTQKVSDYWANVEKDPTTNEKSFYLFPPMKKRSCHLIFDEVDVSRQDWCEYWTVEKILKKYLPFDKALSICCGFGSIERSLSRLNVAKEIYGTDISEGAISIAKEKAIEEGLNNISYFTSDMNNFSSPENIYDLIWANGALHHIEKLESAIEGLYRSLKPGGFLICNEYVGPNYYQFDAKQQVLINTLWKLMPKSLTQENISPTRKYIKKVKKIFNNSSDGFSFKPLQWFLDNDPSEGVRSQDIIPILKNTFNDIDVRFFGGTLLHFSGTFYNNFDYKNSEHREFLELAFDLESSLMNSNIIESENAHIICRKH